MEQKQQTVESLTMRKVAWRILPFVTVGYFLASLDRVNIAFAALQMKQDIALGDAAFGFGAGLFFIAYCLFAVPANMMLERFGPVRWLAFTMVSWGLISSCMAAVSGPQSFYILRFLLGMAEAGFFPGVIFYLTLWFPSGHRSRAVAILMMALPVSSVLGSPLSALLLLTDGWLGMRGWHWLFIIEGSPAIFMGILCLYVLPHDVSRARFLTAQERAWIASQVSEVPGEKVRGTLKDLWGVLCNKYVLVLTLIYIGGTSVTNGLSLWQPQIISTFNLSTMQIGFLNALPFALASFVMYLWSSHSDRTGERVKHLALPLAIGAVALTCIMFVESLLATIVVLCVAITAASMIKGPFWALATEMVPARNAAMAIAMINALNNLGVFAGTYLIGVIKEASGNFTFALVPYLVISVVACTLALWIGRRQGMNIGSASSKIAG
ncbi:MFS transporter [Pseudomonas sp. IT-P4]|jgi:MFS family permease|uniref:MFS transporter n=1 Tax=Pseudomonas sp. IT-P4 TaxID=3026446 RepID=UPI0039E06A05